MATRGSLDRHELLGPATKRWLEDRRSVHAIRAASHCSPPPTSADRAVPQSDSASGLPASRWTGRGIFGSRALLPRSPRRRPLALVHTFFLNVFGRGTVHWAGFGNVTGRRRTRTRGSRRQEDLYRSHRRAPRAQAPRPRGARATHCCKPQRAGGTVVEPDVDSVVADRVPNRVGQRFVLVLSIQPAHDQMIEREGVPCEPPAKTKRPRNTFEGAASVGPGRQMQQQAERAMDQRRLLVERGSRISPSRRSSSTPASAARTACLLEHGGRRVNSDDWPTGRRCTTEWPPGRSRSQARRAARRPLTAQGST